MKRSQAAEAVSRFVKDDDEQGQLLSFLSEFTEEEFAKFLLRDDARDGVVVAFLRRTKVRHESSVAKPPPVVTPTDRSASAVAQLINPPLPGLPTADELATWLFAPPARPVPVVPEVYAMLIANPACQELLSSFTASQSESALARVCSTALEATVRDGTEAWTASAVNQTVVSVLEAMDGLAPIQQRLGLKFERDRGDKTSGMTQPSDACRALRPDGVIRHSDQVRLLLKWEEKEAGDLAGAVDDLRVKTTVWPEVYYGSLPYLLSFAAAGPELQFFAIRRGAVDQPTPIGPVLMLNNLADKARLVVACVQLHRLLGAVASHLPKTVAPVNKILKVITKGITRTLFFDEKGVVHKIIRPWDLFMTRYGLTEQHMTDVYRTTSSLPNLVHSTDGTPIVQNGVYEVILQPVGITPEASIPNTEEQLACAAKGGLTALSSLHKVGMVHRDVRAANFTSNPSKNYYFLIDLELAGHPGIPSFTLHHWHQHNTLVGGHYTAKSDIYDFGVMLSAWENGVMTAEGKDFLQLLKVPAREQAHTAEQLLSAGHVWFSALGV